MAKAIVVGVGPELGLGAALCKRSADEGLEVLVAGRTAANLDHVVEAIVAEGGRAQARVTDAHGRAAGGGAFRRGR